MQLTNSVYLLQEDGGKNGKELLLEVGVETADVGVCIEELREDPVQPTVLLFLCL